MEMNAELIQLRRETIFFNLSDQISLLSVDTA